MAKKNNSKEAKPGDKSRASKRKQQSAPVAAGVSVPEKTWLHKQLHNHIFVYINIYINYYENRSTHLSAGSQSVIP